MPDIAQLQAWFGRTEEAEEEVTAALVRRFRATFDGHPAIRVPERRRRSCCIGASPSPQS